MSKLSGWKRLWIALSIILMLPFGFFAFMLQDMPSRVEDIPTIQQLNKDAVIKIEIPRIGIVEFPDNIDKKEIERIVKSNFDTTKDQIPIIAKKMIQERNEEQAKKARKENEHIRSTNYRTILYAIFGWIGTIFVLYALGWSIGWIHRGFKNT